jgi:hypothetical protein
MQREFDALRWNHTWRLVPGPPRANIVTGKIGLQAQASSQREPGAIQGTTGRAWLHTTSGRRLQPDIFTPGDNSHSCCWTQVASAPARCVQRIPPWIPRRAGALPAARWLRRPRAAGRGLQALQVTVCTSASATRMARAHRRISPRHRLRRHALGQGNARAPAAHRRRPLRALAPGLPLPRPVSLPTPLPSPFASASASSGGGSLLGS